MEVEADVGRLVSWWWKRFRRTLDVVLVVEREAAGFEAMIADCVV